jgi:choice-of-anchor B domain-containing protein
MNYLLERIVSVTITGEACNKLRVAWVSHVYDVQTSITSFGANDVEVSSVHVHDDVVGTTDLRVNAVWLECGVYAGPDSRFTDHEICFCYNEDTLTIVDVTDKAEMRMLSRQSYVGAAYTHQGSINPEMTHLFLNDELDEEEEAELDGHTRSMIWDVSKLDMPTLIGDFFSPEKSIDHNEYIHNGVTWQSNYCAGLRVLDARTMSTGKTTEVAYFDVSPECNTAIFMGAWSAYPFWKSGTVGVQSIERGLFLLKPTFKLE